MPPGEAEPESKTGRGVSPVIGIILMVAIAVILATVVAAFALGFSEDNSEATPSVFTDIDRQITDISPPLEAGTRQISILHEGGDNVPMSELRIRTTAQCLNAATQTVSTKQGELFNLPVSTGVGGGISNSDNVEGDKIFNTRAQAVEKPMSFGSSQTWGAGERLIFHIENDECQVVSEAETTIEVIHEPSNSVIGEESLGEGKVPLNSPADAGFSFSTVEINNDATLNTTVKDGRFDPSLSTLKMKVEVNDGSDSADTGFVQIQEYDGRSNNGATDEFLQDEVGPGDKAVFDLTSKAGGSGPDGFGPLADSNGDTTELTVTVKYNGNIIENKNMEINDYKVDP